jgi:hypothetical protein
MVHGGGGFGNGDGVCSSEKIARGGRKRQSEQKWKTVEADVVAHHAHADRPCGGRSLSPVGHQNFQTLNSKGLNPFVTRLIDEL